MQEVLSLLVNQPTIQSHSNQGKMKQQDKKRFLLGAGLIAGFALGYYLNSKEGRQFRKQAAAQLDEYGEELKGIAEEVGKLAGNYAQEAKIKGREWAEEAAEKGEALSQKARETAAQTKNWAEEKAAALKSKLAKEKAEAEDAAEDLADSFQKGIKNAKSKIDQLGKS